MKHVLKNDFSLFFMKQTFLYAGRVQYPIIDADVLQFNRLILLFPLYTAHAVFFLYTIRAVFPVSHPASPIFLFFIISA